MDEKSSTSGFQDDLYLTCANAVKGLMRRSGYAYLDETTFIERVYARVSLELSDSTVDRIAYITYICKNVYAYELYIGCVSPEKTDQDRAYSQLGDYLYKIAVHFLMTRGCPNDLAFYTAQDDVQQTLKNIFVHIHEIKEPGGFLDYAIRAITRECGKEYHLPLIKLAEAIESLPIEDAAVRKEVREGAQKLKSSGTSGNPPLTRIEDMIQDLKRATRIEPQIQKQVSWITRQLNQSNQIARIEPLDDQSELLPSIPRQNGCQLDCVLSGLAKIENNDQRTVLVLQYFSEFDDRQIAVLLNTNRNNIYQIRNRAIQNFDRDAVMRCMQEC